MHTARRTRVVDPGTPVQSPASLGLCRRSIELGTVDSVRGWTLCRCASLGLSVVWACGGEAPPQSSAPDPELSVAEVEPNELDEVPSVLPRAQAEGPHDIRLGDWAWLDGRASVEVTGAPLQYLWSLARRATGSQMTLGEEAPIVSDGEGRAKFLPDRAGTFAAQLVVVEGELRSEPAFVHVRVLAPLAVPTAVCQTSTRAQVGEVVRFDGSGSTNPLEHIEPLQYYWEPAQLPEASRCLGTVSDVEQSSLSFVPDVPGEYVFMLYVHAAGQGGEPAFASVWVDP